jgi:hypothetical protein
MAFSGWLELQLANEIEAMPHWLLAAAPDWATVKST